MVSKRRWKCGDRPITDTELNIAQHFELIRDCCGDRPEAIESLEFIFNEINRIHNQLLSISGWREGALEALTLACGGRYEP